MRKDKIAAELYDMLCAKWEETNAHLRPSGPSYTESNEAFLFSGELAVDLEQLEFEFGMIRFAVAMKKLRDAKLVR